MSEEAFRVVEFVGVAVEIHEHIYALVEGALYDVVDGCICSYAVAVETAVEMGHTDGAAHHVGAPVIGESLHCTLVIEPRPHVVPAHAHTSELYGLALAVY